MNATQATLTKSDLKFDLNFNIISPTGIHRFCHRIAKGKNTEKKNT